MSWIQVKITCKTEELETVAAVMSMVEPSVMIEDYSDIETGLKTVYGDLIDETILNSDKTVAACSIFLSDETNINEATAYIKSMLEADGITPKVELLGTNEEEWATAWKKYYKPTHIGKRIVIVPSWEEYTAEENEIVIDMDPGMAFGTGTHETTRLCAELLEENLTAGDTILDVGSGSGILAICAAKLGASACEACDIDPIAVRTEKENAERNGCENIECYVSDLLSDVKTKGFDGITANIVADIIIRLAPDAGAYLKDGGYFIASGIIDKREDEVDIAMTAAGFCKCEAKHEKGWCAILYRKA